MIKEIIKKIIKKISAKNCNHQYRLRVAATKNEAYICKKCGKISKNRFLQ